MEKSVWNRESCNPGRSYMLGKDLHVKFEEKRDDVLQVLKEGLRGLIKADPAVRLTLDSPKSNPERAILALPVDSQEELILSNFSKILYRSLVGYYISADPRSSHFGITNLVIEGRLNSLVRREMEKLMSLFQTRPDMAGLLLEGVEMMVPGDLPEVTENHLHETIREGLDIHVGYRIYASGSDVNRCQIFLPLPQGAEIIEQIYHNLECLLHQNFVAYDELSDRYLQVTDTLIFKDLEQILQRAKSKEITRRKILNNLQLTTASESEEGILLPAYDSLYDQLNRIQESKLTEQALQSGRLYAAFETKMLHGYISSNENESREERGLLEEPLDENLKIDPPKKKVPKKSRGKQTTPKPSATDNLSVKKATLQEL